MRKDRVVVKGGNEGVIGLEERKDEALPVSKRVQCVDNVCTMCVQFVYSNYRNYAPPLDVKGGIITKKRFPCIF